LAAGVASMDTHLDQNKLRARADESYLQYYALILGISQGVILSIFIDQLSQYGQGINFTNEGVQLGLNILHTFFLMLGVYYSYYWYTMLYRHVIRFHDIVMPVLVALTEAYLVYSMKNGPSYYLAVAVFYASIVLAFIFLLHYTNRENFYDKENPPLSQWIYNRFWFHIVFATVNTLIGSIVALALYYLASRTRVFDSIFVILIATVILYSLLFTYFLQERNFIAFVFRTFSVAPLQFEAGTPTFTYEGFTLTAFRVLKSEILSLWSAFLSLPGTLVTKLVR
jgi:hypothetical protein